MGERRWASEFLGIQYVGVMLLLVCLGMGWDGMGDTRTYGYCVAVWCNVTCLLVPISDQRCKILADAVDAVWSSEF